jgi:hypothetical protein
VLLACACSPLCLLDRAAAAGAGWEGHNPPAKTTGLLLVVVVMVVLAHTLGEHGHRERLNPSP